MKLERKLELAGKSTRQYYVCSGKSTRQYYVCSGKSTRQFYQQITCVGTCKCPGNQELQGNFKSKCPANLKLNKKVNQRFTNGITEDPAK